MVYNAMKLFMEINPQLFDECSEHYREHEATAEKTLRTRTANWALIADWAKRNSNGENAAIPPLTDLRGQKFNPPSRIDEDPITQDSQKRLDALRLQDESGSSGHGRRQRGLDGQYLVRPQASPFEKLTVSLTSLLSIAYGRPSNTNPPTPRAERVKWSSHAAAAYEARDAQQRPARRMILSGGGKICEAKAIGLSVFIRFTSRTCMCWDLLLP